MYGLYRDYKRDYGKENGNCYLGARVCGAQGLGSRVGGLGLRVEGLRFGA